MGVVLLVWGQKVTKGGSLLVNPAWDYLRCLCSFKTFPMQSGGTFGNLHFYCDLYNYCVSLHMIRVTRLRCEGRSSVLAGITLASSPTEVK